ncbi:replication protein A 70 kDa DNA-binding subunit-like isoform X2 [Paramacrobiotus metropolitanus]|uniref:replication protein A 70 kDa DNA-binding subunit-like isoform X2 n=1 Tax=Paramacrobiotus metropolitanus TaxID=2943436 RepID=UPI00244572CA|nr:replication protein A 70 kDa DNA-binding subunit-like isoform X2 [Paramacrobiotus metropolitanus]
MAFAAGEPELSEGCIRAILNGVDIHEPRVQLLEARNVNQNHYRLLINDYRNTYSFVMLATQLNHLVDNNTLTPYSVIIMKKYVVNNRENKSLIILLEVKVAVPGDQIGRKLGSPVSLGDNGMPTGAARANPNAHAGNPAVAPAALRPPVPQQGLPNPATFSSSSFQSPSKQPAPFPGGPAAKRPNLGSPSKGNNSSGAGNVPVSAAYNSGGSFQAQQPTMPPLGSASLPQNDTQNIHPISALNPYNSAWAIRAKVMSKDSIRFWNKPNSQGKVFSVLVTDGESEIKISGFNNEVDRFYDVFEVGKTYYIKNGLVKNADPKYSRGRMYDINLEPESIVEECSEDAGLVKIRYNFVPFYSLLTLSKDANIDVIGVCSSAGELFQGKNRQSGRDFTKRDLDIIDDTSTCVRVTLWGPQAEKYEKNVVLNKVVAIHGCRLAELNGTRSLSTSFDAIVEVDPDIPEGHKLRGWYDSGGCNVATQALMGTGMSGNFGSGSTPFKCFWQIEAEGLGNGDKADFFMIRAVIMKAFARDNTLYRACVNSGCSKKVTDQGNGTFRCEKCNTENDSFVWRLMLTVQVADCTGSAYATVFQENAEKVLQQDAQSLGEMKTQDATVFEKAINNCQFQAFMFKMKVKTESYNDEWRRKYTVITAEPLNFAAETKRLQETLVQMGIA